MHRFAAINFIGDSGKLETFPRDAVHSLRSAVLFPPYYKPNIEQALQRVDFKIYRRTCSFADLIRECNCVVEGETLLMFRGSLDRECSESRFNMSASSCSSLHVHLSTQSSVQDSHGLRSIAQQTDISCRQSPSVSLTPSMLANEAESQRAMRACLAGSLFSSPASSLLQPAPRSVSILGSVCALLLNKQGSSVGAKEVSSFTGSQQSDICRICFGGESVERLVRPCSCRGTIAAVHRACLERWLLQAATSHCELCKHHYIVTRSHKWSWVWSLAAWARGRGRALAGDAWRGLALGAGCAWGTARALAACDALLRAGARRGGASALAANLLSSLLIGIIGALNGLLTTWMLLKIQEHTLSWQAWRDSTLHVHVTLADEDQTLTPRSSATTVVAGGDDSDDSPTIDRSTNIADPFMVALPYTLPDP